MVWQACWQALIVLPPHVITNTLLAMDKESDLRKNFRETHPRLDNTTDITHQGFDKIKETDT